MSKHVAGRRTPVIGRRTAVVVAVLAGVATAVTATPAAAGGWWSTPQLEHGELVIGETATVSAGLMFASVGAAEEARDSREYFAYLVKGIDEEGLQEAMSNPGPRAGWWTTPDWAGLLAPLTLDGGTDNLGGARATFVVPEVEPGIYDVMLCDRGCTTPLADVVPLRDVYVGDAAFVRLLRDGRLETKHLLDEVGTVRSQLERLEDDTGTLSDDVDALGQRFDEGLEGLTTSRHQLTAALATLETRIAEGDPQAPVPTPWWTLAGWFLAGACLAIAWMARRRGPVDEASHDRYGGTASIDVDDAHPSPPELITWELERGPPVR